MLLLVCTPAATLGAAPALPDQAPAIVEIGFKKGPADIDGSLDELAWKDAAMITLTQQSPMPGISTPFHTTVQMLRDKRYLYFGITCDDPEPQSESIHTLRRDTDQSADDNVMIVLDSFNQKKLAYVFQVNAGGAMADGLISPGYYNSNSNTPNVDYNWNGYWEAVVKRTNTGWTAEIRLDTESMQFDKNNGAWGINIARYVPRKLLTLAWSGINLNASVTNLQWEGQLTGMQDLTQGAGIEFNPYIVTEYSDEKHDTASWRGFDAKYNFTSQLAGLFTFHTDFSEAPANTLSATISPYQQSVQETRQFFLDGANIFTFGHNLGQNFIPFYSRSIGLINGTPVPVNEGFKMLGDADNWTLGILDTQMAGTNLSDATNLFAGRAIYNIDDQWRAGALVTHGDPIGQSDNTLTSFDSTWSTSHIAGDRNLNVSAWEAQSSGSASANGIRRGYGFDVEYPNDLWYADINYNYFGNSLDPALGFVQRPGTKQTSVDVIYQPRPGDNGAFDWVRQFFFEGAWYYVTDLDNKVQSDDWTIRQIHVTTQDGWQYNAQFRVNHEVLAQPYQLLPTVTFPAGSYDFNIAHFFVNSPTADPLSFYLIYEFGDYYNGHYREFVPNITWAVPGGHFTGNVAGVVTWIDTPTGNGILRLSQFTLGYSVTPNLTISALTQYNNVSRNTSENAILQWNIQPNRVFYFVWNHGLTLNPSLLQGTQTITGNTVVAKLVWGFY